MARKQRRAEAISLSFLDIMSCGFGAVVLFFMIINATVSRRADTEAAELMSETTRLEREVLEGRKDMVKVRNTLEQIEEERVRTEGEAERIQERIQRIQEELAQYNDTTLARIERIEKLRSDIEQLEAEKKRLEAAAAEEAALGDNVRAFRGEGDRQYLTGLKVGGDRVLVLVDASASMLDKKVVNVLRRRNMADEDKLRAAKWRQAIASVDWITTQFRPDAQFQIYTFNDTAEPVIDGSKGVWLDVGDGRKLAEALRRLRITIPQGGTNLQGAYQVISQLKPRPDNVFLLVDSLPTRGNKPPARQTISGIQRQALHGQAAREVPSGIPINVMLFPMEGDYAAPIEFWKLAYRTRGSFMSISKDWP
jgi:hypothetical protein